MKKIAAICLIIVSLVAACVPAFAETRDVSPGYVKMTGPTAYIYSDMTTGSRKVLNVNGKSVAFFYNTGTPYWASAKYETTQGTWRGYVPLTGMDISLVHLRNSLFTNFTLKSGDRGTGVKWLQSFLNKAGYNPGSIDGIWGTKTQNAVIAFQKANGLTVDGLAGKDTKDKLLEVTNIGGYADRYE